MDFEQLRIFMVLAEERTFLGAANRLATSRSRVRRKLDQLEADAGTALVSREQTGLILTPAGEALVRRGRALLEDAQQLIAHVRDVGEEPTGLLKIGLPFAPLPPGWNDLCREIQRAHPGLGLEFVHAEEPNDLLPTRAELARADGLTLTHLALGGLDSLSFTKRVSELRFLAKSLDRGAPEKAVLGSFTSKNASNISSVRERPAAASSASFSSSSASIIGWML